MRATGDTAVRGGLPEKEINLEESTSQRRQTESDQSSSRYRAPAPHPAYAIPSPPTHSPTQAIYAVCVHMTLGSYSRTYLPSSFSWVSHLDILQTARAHFSLSVNTGLQAPAVMLRRLCVCAGDLNSRPHMLWHTEVSFQPRFICLLYPKVSIPTISILIQSSHFVIR